MTRRSDQPGIARVQHVGTETEAFDRAGTEVLDEHVGVVDESQHRVETALGLQVEHDAALAPSEQLPRVGVAALGREPAHAAHTVARRRLDLDDRRPEIGEVPGGAGPCEDRRHVDDTHTFQGIHGAEG